MKGRAGRVRIAGQDVGVIEERGPTVAFTYCPQWLSRPDASPVSLTMPLRPESYVSNGPHPFFENLLPEGWLLDVVSKQLAVAKDDAFGLLLAVCRDCPGDVEIEPIATEGPGQRT